MRALRLSRLLALTLAVASMPFTIGCGEDDEPTGAGNTIVGSWTATCLIAPSQPAWGDGVADDGLSVRITFNSNGSYSWTVSNDDPADPWICDITASCNWTGPYTISGNSVVFDQGTADELSASFSVSSSTLDAHLCGHRGDHRPLHLRVAKDLTAAPCSPEAGYRRGGQHRAALHPRGAHGVRKRRRAASRCPPAYGPSE